MGKKITLNLKVNACPHCKSANKTKLRQHRPDYCKVGFEARNGHCANFAERPGKVSNG